MVFRSQHCLFSHILIFNFHLSLPVAGGKVQCSEVGSTSRRIKSGVYSLYIGVGTYIRLEGPIENSARSAREKI
jgi:hypothetical protein